ncbi:hypothetical protein D3P96_07250 [Weissella viridescens]|uniref:Putative zinc ribbon domain-containing protein n=1 Tax=Weissella viridescens TaxID=1629 RepID=A0A3P2RAQ3_WEIVI|nr:zinc ribbon domain-containing protein [Weissella viridescens]RRG17564.1 hypothetical protein D3P96_07250 [Weissella viridescens]
MHQTNLCQSCGMPIDKHTLAGTNADGSPSSKYCAYCYQDGHFTEDDSFDEMYAKNYQRFLESDMNKFQKFFLKRMYTKKFMHGLDRWKNN